MTGGAAAAEIERNAELFRVLGHETRLRLLMLLAAGEHAVSALESASGIGQPGLSQQLAILRKAELVITRRVAKQVYYRVDPAALGRTAALLASLAETATDTAPARPAPGAARRGGGSAAGFARLL
ncbi:ArsR/SmtB family transcription factor [Sandarakinorhabdus sp.]|uniref:ArsR/SmtB family transcription factor n=1 Tax=Sandarakinorhabdus sp. TaxID=1916663 RepID=UPI003F72CC75